MTVKILPFEHKTHIAHLYAHENMGTNEIAKLYSVSSRTINRVLVEMGVARTPKRKPKVTAPVQSKEVWVQQPITMFEPTLIDKIKTFFKPLIEITKKHVQLSR